MLGNKSDVFERNEEVRLEAGGSETDFGLAVQIETTVRSTITDPKPRRSALAPRAHRTRAIATRAPSLTGSAVTWTVPTVDSAPCLIELVISS